MKPICDESNVNQINNNWLGFFLSAPTMEREANHPHHQTQPFSNVVSGAVPFSSSPSFNYPGIYHGVEGQNAGFGSPLLNSDVSLNGQDLASYHQENNLQLPLMADDEPAPMTNWVSRNSTPNVQKTNVEEESGVTGSLGHGMKLENKKRGPEKVEQKQIVRRKSIETFGQRTSQYRGVTRHRWTGRYEAHLWDNSCKKEGQSRKGRQVYLGGYDVEENAARAYDLAALKYWGFSSHINFAVENYEQELQVMNNMSRQEYVAHLRRRSSGFSRGASIYRGVTRHHQHGRWQARIGRVAGNKDLYLGTFSTQEEAAEAYDVAAIKFRGANAVTNFVASRYDVERIMASDNLLSGDMARRSKKEVVNSSFTNAKDIKVNSTSNGCVGNSSLSSSREGSPINIIDRENGHSMQLPLSNELLPFGVNSWIPSAQMSFPVFYAWADAS